VTVAIVVIITYHYFEYRFMSQYFTRAVGTCRPATEYRHIECENRVVRRRIRGMENGRCLRVRENHRTIITAIKKKN